MKIILLQDVRAVGRKNEVREVADGYAMNFLIARKLAEPATAEKIAALQKLKEQHEVAAKAQEEKIAGVIKSLSNAKIELHVRATEKGGLFKTIGPSEIARAIEDELQAQLPQDSISISTPIKTTGEHTIHLRGEGAKADITLSLIPLR